jgi:Flp pilus assembly protein CpaB
MGIVILAILAGLVGAYIVRSSLIREPVAEPPAPAMVTVPLASVDLPEGRTIAMGDIALMSMTQEEMTKQGIPAGAMLDPDQIIGRTLKEPIRQMKPFVTGAFYLEGTRGDYTRELRPGQRAVSLQVPKNAGGSLPPGTMVDVLFRSAERPAAQGRMAIPEVTVRLLESVRIIDVYDPPPPRQTGPAVLDLRRGISRTPPPPTVTLAVTPEQGEAIQAVAGRGEMTLVARPENERLAAAGRRKPLTLHDVLGIEPPPPTILFATEIYRRGSRSVNVFRDDKLVEQMKAAQEAATGPAATPPAPTPAPPAPTPAPPAPAPAPPSTGAATLQPTVPEAAVPVVPMPMPMPISPGAGVVPMPMPMPMNP